jgi:hypothetical protein
MPSISRTPSPRSESRPKRFHLSSLIAPAAIVAILGLWLYTRITAMAPTAESSHPAAAHPGMIASLAGDRYHVAAVLEQGGVLRLFPLDRDASRVLAVEKQNPTAYLRAAGDWQSVAVALTPQPQPGDPRGRVFAVRRPLPGGVLPRRN